MDTYTSVYVEHNTDNETLEKLKDSGSNSVFHHYSKSTSINFFL